MIIKKTFYTQDTKKVAQELLGCFLIRKIGAMIIKTMIVETEAYCGPKDLASHASRGRTARNAVMFGSSGTIYVYFTYGMHYMLNIVTESDGYPAAVLIRAIEKFEVKSKKLEVRSMKLVTNGPAKLTKFLSIDKKFNGLPVYTKKYGLWIEAGEEIKPAQIIKRPRIGVDYAGKYIDKKWRYYIKDNKFVSKY